MHSPGTGGRRGMRTRRTRTLGSRAIIQWRVIAMARAMIKRGLVFVARTILGISGSFVD